MTIEWKRPTEADKRSQRLVLWTRRFRQDHDENSTWDQWLLPSVTYADIAAQSDRSFSQVMIAELNYPEPTHE